MSQARPRNKIGGSATRRVSQLIRVGRVELKATVGKTSYFDLDGPLSWLRDNASDVHVELTIDAIARDEGFDRVKLRNGVVEPLEEGGIHVNVNWHNPPQ